MNRKRTLKKKRKINCSSFLESVAVSANPGAGEARQAGPVEEPEPRGTLSRKMQPGQPQATHTVQ